MLINFTVRSGEVRLGLGIMRPVGQGSSYWERMAGSSTTAHNTAITQLSLVLTHTSSRFYGNPLRCLGNSCRKANTWNKFHVFAWWVARDLNPRPPRCKRGALAN